MGAELINLRRARKGKARAEKAREAEANRARHGTPKAARDLGKARAEKAARDLDAQRLDRDKDEA
ncbi:MAG TPA: DUF4169 family protein [Rhizomicrobium sp.]|nr:DUF4169 family protein [Rhizomicrobium sp.]